MNRGGLDGATWTMDDRFTGYDAASIADVPVSRAARCCSASTTPTPAPPRRSRAARRRSPSSPASGLMAMVEPLPYHREDDGSLRLLKDVRVAGPRDRDRQRARHDERLHLAEDAVLRRPGGGLRGDDAAVRGARRRAAPRPGRGPRVLGPRARPSRPCAAWSSAGRCSTRPTARCSPRSTRPRRCCAPRGRAAVSLLRRGARRRRPGHRSSTSRPRTPAGTGPGCGCCGWRRVSRRPSRPAASELFVLPLAGVAAGRRAGEPRPSSCRAATRCSPGSPTSATSAATASPSWRQRRRRRGGAAVVALRARAAAGVRRRPRTSRSRCAAPAPATRQVTNFGVPGRLGPRRQAGLLRADHPGRQLVELPAAQARRERPVPGRQRGDLLLPDRRRTGDAIPRASATTAPTPAPSTRRPGWRRSTRPTGCATTTSCWCRTATTGRASRRRATRCTTST